MSPIYSFGYHVPDFFLKIIMSSWLLCPPCQSITSFPWIPVTLLLCFPVTMLLCYLITLLPSYSVTCLLCYSFTLLLCYFSCRNLLASHISVPKPDCKYFHSNSYILAVTATEGDHTLTASAWAACDLIGYSDKSISGTEEGGGRGNTFPQEQSWEFVKR